MELKVIDNKGKESKSVKFDENLWANKVSPALLHEVVVAHLANQRSGTHDTKTKAEVSGGGKKPWRQKGTGRARAGSIRSPLWRHGGTIFGPKPRSYQQNLPAKKKQMAFKRAIQGLVESDRFQVVDPIEVKEAKTKNVAAVYKKWKAPTDSLLVVDKKEPNFVRASRNIADVSLVDVASLNTYECLKARRVFITTQALEKLSERLAKTQGKSK